MKVAEIQEIEKTNFENIYLFKEGIFWRVYEKSAWRFVKNIREYRVFRKYIKAVKHDIVYLGFPESILHEILSIVETNHAFSNIIHKSEILIEIQGFTDVVGFEQWKSEIDITTAKEKSSEGKQDEIIRKIKDYPIMNKTPMDAFNFLVVIQKEIHK